MSVKEMPVEMELAETQLDLSTAAATMVSFFLITTTV